MIKELYRYAYSVKKISIYKRDSDKTKWMYFLINDENFFYIYNEIWVKVSNIIKKVIENLYIIKST